jgi:hypothetical protein
MNSDWVWPTARAARFSFASRLGSSRILFTIGISFKTHLYVGGALVKIAPFIEKREAATKLAPQEKAMTTRSAMVGTRAPDFSLPCIEMPGPGRRQVSLDDYLDRWLVLLFYPRDFSLV